MTASAITIGFGGINGYTTADLHALPDDGHRWELIDGSLTVSPSATSDHNIIAHWIASALMDSNPSDDFLVSTDQSTTLDDHNELRPDVIVAPIDFLQQTPFPITGTRLVVEIVSPSSVLRDTEVKRTLYARAGVPAYWIVTAALDEPTIRLAELVLDEPGGRYRFATHYTHETFVTQLPWPVKIDLPRLTEKRARSMRTRPTEA